MAWSFSSIRGYRRSYLPRDVIAGLTVWAVLIPEALAYVESVPSIDVSATDMLQGLVDRLTANHVRVVFARELGQVRDLLSVAERGREPFGVYPTVRAGVEACRRETGP